MIPASNPILLLLVLILTQILSSTLTRAEGECTETTDYCWSCPGVSYSTNSAYHENLERLMLSASFNSTAEDDEGNGNYLFRNASVGKIPDKIRAIGLCRGRLDEPSCQACLNASAPMLLKKCPGKKEAVLWDKLCMVRYSSNSTFGVKEDEPMTTLKSPDPALDTNQFDVVLNPLLDGLISEAATSTLKFACDSKEVSSGNSIYALMQCTTDLSEDDCRKCLQDARLEIPDCCAGRDGARILKPSCNLRYERGPFYDTETFVSSVPTAYPPPPPGDPIKRAQLDWDTRYKIIQGIVRGLLYLHEDSRLRIIHRDLKVSNILLDEDMTPKISDFGIAKLFEFDQTQGNTSQIVGTPGYIAPEYRFHGHFSVKSDVFSFGVLLLEIVSGQKNTCIRSDENVEYFPTFAWRNWMEGTANKIIDPIISIGSLAEIMRCIHIGLLCVQDNAADRPTMNSVGLMLNSQSSSLDVPSEPAFFMQSTFGGNQLLSSNISSEGTTQK